MFFLFLTIRVDIQLQLSHFKNIFLAFLIILPIIQHYFDKNQTKFQPLSFGTDWRLPLSTLYEKIVYNK